MSQLLIMEKKATWLTSSTGQTSGMRIKPTHQSQYYHTTTQDNGRQMPPIIFLIYACLLGALTSNIVETHGHPSPQAAFKCPTPPYGHPSPQAEEGNA